MTTNWLEEIEARWAKTTPGPWEYTAGILKCWVDSPNADLHLSFQDLHPMDGREWQSRETASAIAHAPEDVARLCAEVKALRAQAALDATVVEAIGPYREADSAVTRAYNRYVASKGTSEEAVAEFDLNWTRGVFVGYERVLDDALDAALAARKGMT
jgi:hypothetical protein